MIKQMHKWESKYICSPPKKTLPWLSSSKTTSYRKLPNKMSANTPESQTFFVNKNSMELKKQTNKQELSAVVTDFHIYILGIIS